MSREDVVAAIPPRRKFSVADVAEKSGASTATARSVVVDMLGNGELEDLGPAEAHSGRGRAPTQYKRAGK